MKRILRETRDKIVIVSQWTSFLNVVSDFLHRERVHYVELTGKTAIKNRNDIVVSFNNPDTPERVSYTHLKARQLIFTDLKFYTYEKKLQIPRSIQIF